MPFQRWGRTFYRLEEFRALSLQEQEAVRAEHRANPVPQEVLREAFPLPAEDDIDRELRQMLEEGERGSDGAAG